eukprot:6213606-Pleurochrysis_carterae.AAC.2
MFQSVSYNMRLDFRHAFAKLKVGAAEVEAKAFCALQAGERAYHIYRLCARREGRSAKGAAPSSARVRRARRGRAKA